MDENKIICTGCGLKLSKSDRECPLCGVKNKQANGFAVLINGLYAKQRDQYKYNQKSPSSWRDEDDEPRIKLPSKNSSSNVNNLQRTQKPGNTARTVGTNAKGNAPKKQDNYDKISNEVATKMIALFVFYIILQILSALL